jgi:hypothetical protein
MQRLRVLRSAFALRAGWIPRYGSVLLKSDKKSGFLWSPAFELLEF